MKLKTTFTYVKSVLLLLAALTFTFALADQAGAAKVLRGSINNFRASRTYEDGLFTDVSAGEWYASGVAEAYELGLFNGKSEGRFDPNGELSVVEVVTLAARLHSIFYTGDEDFAAGRVWYESYVRYALNSGILDNRRGILLPASRARFADILSRCVPERELPEIGEVPDEAIPDVGSDNEYADAIYLLYRAGVLSGSDDWGSFHPDSTITRAEAAVIITRITNPSRREKITLTTGTDVPERPEADDSFFVGSAILGNSLVEGLQMFSNLKTLEYFCNTGMSVDSATGADSGLVQSLCSTRHDRIYIELGINEISYSPETFISRYSALLDRIIASQPDAEIFIISVLPVTMSKSVSSIYNMDRVNAFNEALYNLAVERDCRYLDVCSAMTGDDGYLPATWSWDGIHLQAAHYSVWENYMRTHY